MKTLLLLAIHVLPPLCIEADRGSIFWKGPESHDRNAAQYELFATPAWRIYISLS
jgi:hypothetical protein